ncbi:hypothetical protein MRX96_042354 [Rhipicephalus microplus]
MTSWLEKKSGVSEAATPSLKRRRRRHSQGRSLGVRAAKLLSRPLPVRPGVTLQIPAGRQPRYGPKGSFRGRKRPGGRIGTPLADEPGQADAAASVCAGVKFIFTDATGGTGH